MDHFFLTLLSVTSILHATERTEKCETRYIQELAVELRLKPAVDGARLDTLTLGRSVCEISNSDGWVKVQVHKSLSGWLPKEVLEKEKLDPEEAVKRAESALKSQSKNEAVTWAEKAVYFNPQKKTYELLQKAYELAGSPKAGEIKKLFATLPESSIPYSLYVDRMAGRVEEGFPKEGVIAGDYAPYSTQEWLGFSKDKCHLIPIQIKEKKETATDLNSTEQMKEEGSVLTTLPKGLGFALNKKLGLVAGNVKCATVTPHSLDFTFNDKKYRVEIPSYRGETDCLRPGLQRINLYAGEKLESAWLRDLCSIEAHGLTSGVSELVWAGDLDGDTKVDLLIALPDHPMAGSFMLLQSVKSAQHAVYQYSLIGNPGC